MSKKPWTWVMHGDCLDRMHKIEDCYVDLILCDLPYGTTALAWDSVIDLPSLWSQYSRIAKPNAAIVLFGAEPFSSTLRSSNTSIYKYDWYWRKSMPSGVAFAAYQPMRVIETISVFYSNRPVYNKQLTESVISDRKIRDGAKNGSGSNGSNHVKMAQVKNVQKSMVSPRNLLEFRSVGNAGGHKLHPTQKPVELMEYLIKTYTNEGQTVLDNCMGSGTTGVACVNTGRNFIGIEKDDKYYPMAVTRIKEAKNKA